MSKTQKQAAISPFIYLPLGGAAIGGLADYAIGRKLRQKAEVDSNGKKIKTPEGEVDSKENARRLLRSLILGGGVGLGMATTLNGGERILRSVYGLDKTSSAKSSKLLAKLVKRATDENNFFADPKSNYLIGGGASLLGGLALYHFLNDKKKRNLLGYLGSGLTGLGAGLAGAGLYNKSFHGNWLGVPEQPEPENKNENVSQKPGINPQKPSDGKGQTPETKTPPASPEEMSAEVSDETGQLDPGSEQPPVPTELENKQQANSTNPWISYLNYLWPGAAGASSLGLLTGAGNSYLQNRPPAWLVRMRSGNHDIVKNSPEYFRQLESWKKSPTPSVPVKHPLLRKIFKHSLNAVPYANVVPTFGYGNWLGNLAFKNKVSPEVMKEFMSSDETPNWEPKKFTKTKGGIDLKPTERARISNLAETAQRWELLANNHPGDTGARLMANASRKALNRALKGYQFKEMTPDARSGIFGTSLEGTGLDASAFDNYTYTGKKDLLKKIIEFEQAREADPNWSVNKGVLGQADTVKDSLPPDILDKVNKGRYALEAGEIKSPIEGMANQYADAVQKAYADYIADPTNEAKYNALEKSVNTYKDALKNPKTFRGAGFVGAIADYGYSPDSLNDINAANDILSGKSKLSQEEALDVMQRVKDIAPEALRPEINRGLRVSDIVSTYKGQPGGMPEPIRQAIADYTATPNEALFNKIENAFIDDMSQRYRTSSYDLTPEFRNKFNNGEYQEVKSLVEDLDRLQSRINALEQFSETPNQNAIELARNEYNQKLNTLLEKVPDAAGKSVRSQILEGGRKVLNMADKFNTASENFFERLDNWIKQRIGNKVQTGEPESSWVDNTEVPEEYKRLMEAVERAKERAKVPPIPEGTPENAPEPSTGNSAVDEKLNEINERRNATEGGEVQNPSENTPQEQQQPELKRRKPMTEFEIAIWNAKSDIIRDIDSALKNKSMTVEEAEKLKNQVRSSKVTNTPELEFFKNNMASKLNKTIENSKASNSGKRRKALNKTMK